MLGKKIDNVWTIGSIQTLFPNTSFSNVPNASWMLANEVYDVVSSKVYDIKTQKQVNCDPYLEDGKLHIVKIESKTDAEKTEYENYAKEKMRKTRNDLLLASDWTQVADFTHPKKSEWITYRQQLRDLPSVSGFPYVDFPTEPSS